MKKILAILALAVPAIVHAETIAYTDNQLGGRIVLTQRACPGHKAGSVAFLTSAGGEMIDTGCWGHAKPFFIVHWKSNGADRFYNEEGFSYTDLDKQ